MFGLLLFGFKVQWFWHKGWRQDKARLMVINVFRFETDYFSSLQEIDPLVSPLVLPHKSRRAKISSLTLSKSGKTSLKTVKIDTKLSFLFEKT